MTRHDHEPILRGLLFAPDGHPLQAAEMIQAVWDEVQTLHATVSEPAVVLTMRNLSAVWNEMFPEERCRLVRLLIAKVQLKDEGGDIEWQPAGWSALMEELAPNSIGAELRELEMEAMA